MLTRLILVFILLATNSCDQSHGKRTTIIDGLSMTMYYKVIIGKPLNFKERENVASIITATFNEVDEIYNRYNENSEISRFNKAQAGELISMSHQLTNFLEKTDRLVTLTEGRFDPTIEPAYQLWKINLIDGRTPSPEEQIEVASTVGWDKIHINGSTISKDLDGIALDLGGIAKGYAIDLIAERLINAGYNDIYVEWGGEIRTHGQHPDKRPWRVGVSDFRSNEAVAIIDLSNRSVASSGDYLQNWIVDGNTYCHIFDPHAGHPLLVTEQSVGSATVIADSCLVADVLATTLMLFPSPDAARVWFEEKFPQYEVWVQSRSNTLTTDINLPLSQ